MISNSLHLTVCDAGPIIHLDELGCLDLLEGFETLMIPRIVWQEVSLHRHELSLGKILGAELVADENSYSPELVALCRSLDLDAGEKSAIAILQKHQGGLFLTDDAAARLVAERMGFAARGSIGIIVRSLRRGTRTLFEVRQLLTSIPEKSSLHLQNSLLQKVLSELPNE